MHDTLRPWALEENGVHGWSMRATCPRCHGHLRLPLDRTEIACACGARLSLHLGRALPGTFKEHR